MDGFSGRGKIFPAMTPLNLTDDELQDAAQAARIASEQAEKDAERHTNPIIRSMFDGTARRWRELADKFERARFGEIRRGGPKSTPHVETTPSVTEYCRSRCSRCNA